MIAKLLIPVALGVGLFAFSSSSSAKPKKASDLPGADKSPPGELVKKIEEAVRTGDPAKMRELANQLDAMGFMAQGADLRAAAAAVERAASGAPALVPLPGTPAAVRPSPVGPVVATSPGFVPPPLGTAPPRPVSPAIVPPLPIAFPAAAPIPAGTPISLPIPGAGVVPAPAAPADVGQVLAGKVALYFRNFNYANRGREDRALVKQFQIQETAKGVPIGAIDGLYGPKTALALARYGIVPPKPLYWPRDAAAVKRAKVEYQAELLRLANSDPLRAEEWRAASNV